MTIHPSFLLGFCHVGDYALPNAGPETGGFRPAPISSARRVPFQVTPNDTQRHSTTVQRPDLGQSGPFGRPELCHPTRPNCAKAPVRPEPVVQPALRLGHGALDALDLPERSGPVLPLPCLTKQEFLIFHCALHSRDEHWKEKNAHNQETQEYRVRPRGSGESQSSANPTRDARVLTQVTAAPFAPAPVGLRPRSGPARPSPGPIKSGLSPAKSGYERVNTVLTFASARFNCAACFAGLFAPCFAAL